MNEELDLCLKRVEIETMWEVAHLQDFTINTINLLHSGLVCISFSAWVLVQELVHFVTIVQSLLWMQSLKLGIPYFFDQTPRLLFRCSFCMTTI